VQAKLFIDDNYFEQIDLDNIADEACFSKFHFIRLFKKIYGYTPHNYLTKVRIEKSKLFLQENLPITDVCYKIGFDSLGSFSVLFKKYSGLSPSEYQQKYLQRQLLIQKQPLQFVPNCFIEAKN